MVNIVAQRGTYTVDSLARDVLGSIENPYQKEVSSNIPKVPIHTLQSRFGMCTASSSDFEDEPLDQDDNKDANYIDDDIYIYIYIYNEVDVCMLINFRMRCTVNDELHKVRFIFSYMTYVLRLYVREMNLGGKALHPIHVKFL